MAVVTKLWSLPPEFEAISRDVWSLALTLKRDIPHIESGDSEHKSGEQTLGAANSDDGDSEGDNSDSEGPESEHGDASVINLLDHLSEEDDSGAEPPNEPQPIIRLRGKSLVSVFPYYLNVAVLLVSCWILRLPVIYSDILKWVSPKGTKWCKTLTSLHKVSSHNITCHIWIQSLEAFYLKGWLYTSIVTSHGRSLQRLEFSLFT